MLWHCWLQMSGFWHSSSSTQDTWSSAKVNPGWQEHWARPLSARHWSWQPPLFTAHGSSSRQERPSRSSLYLHRQHHSTVTPQSPPQRPHATTTIAPRLLHRHTTSVPTTITTIPLQTHYHHHYKPLNHHTTTSSPCPLPSYPIHLPLYVR